MNPSSSSVLSYAKAPLPTLSIGIFWDWENIKIPPTLHVKDVVNLALGYVCYDARHRFVPDSGGPRFDPRRGEQTTRLYYDSAKKPPMDPTQKSYLSSFGVNLQDCPTRNSKETIDKNIIVDMCEFAFSNLARAQDNCVVLISSDGDYSYTLKRLQACGSRVVVVHLQSTHVLIYNGGIVHNWDHICRYVLLNERSVRAKVFGISEQDLEDGGAATAGPPFAQAQQQQFPPLPLAPGSGFGARSGWGAVGDGGGGGVTGGGGLSTYSHPRTGGSSTDAESLDGDDDDASSVVGDFDKLTVTPGLVRAMSGGSAARGGGEFLQQQQGSVLDASALEWQGLVSQSTAELGRVMLFLGLIRVQQAQRSVAEMQPDWTCSWAASGSVAGTFYHRLGIAKGVDNYAKKAYKDVLERSYSLGFVIIGRKVKAAASPTLIPTNEWKNYRETELSTETYFRLTQDGREAEEWTGE